jgi:putative ATPase
MVLNLIDFAYKVDKNLSLNTLSNLANHSYEGINSKELHYDLISAMIKSIRGSDIDASLYYLARLIVAGERAEFIARRLLILASEDISNANPNAINLATNTYIASKYIGYPEIKIILAQCTIYLASSPKSNSSYKAINKAIDEIKNGNILSIPSHLKDKATNYLYPHDFDGYIKQQYLSKDLKFYQSKLIGFEKTLDEWIKKIKKLI